MVLIRFAQDELEPRQERGLDLSKFPHFELEEDQAAANYIVSQAHASDPDYDPSVKVIQSPDGAYGILALEDSDHDYMPEDKGGTLWGESLIETANYLARSTANGWRWDVTRLLKNRGFGPGDMSSHKLWEYTESMLQQRLEDSRKGVDWSEQDESIMTRSDDRPVIYIKYNGKYDPPDDIKEDMEKIFTEEEIGYMWSWTQEDWWEQAKELAKEHGFEDVYSEGAQGGYLFPVYQGNREVDLSDPEEMAQFKLFKQEIDSLYEGAEEMLMEQYRYRFEERKYEMEQAGEWPPEDQEE